MDFRQDELHRDLQQMYRDFALKEVKPLAAEIDKEERFPTETVAKMAESGFLGIPFPEEYGGTGMDNLSYAQCVEELSRVCASMYGMDLLRFPSPSAPWARPQKCGGPSASGPGRSPG